MLCLEKRIETILKQLEKSRYSDPIPITGLRIKESGDTACLYEDMSAEGWRAFRPGEYWGGVEKHAWLKASVSLPASLAGKPVYLRIRTGREEQWAATNPQFLAYIDGRIVQGLDTNHTQLLLTPDAVAGARYELSLCAYSGRVDIPFTVELSLLSCHPGTDALYYDIKTPLEAVLLLDKADKRRVDTVELLNTAVNLLDLRRPASPDFYASVAASAAYLGSELYQKNTAPTEITARCVGHTHIDVAWLWTVAQTREKAVRSFATALELMERYPEYTFLSSQPQLYQFVKEDAPELYEKIKARVREGRWEAEGAMWLEADCNLISGESLVRQILFGKRFFKQEFGIDSKLLWLPDAFGFSAALPQIMKKSGVEYFMTTKLSWNEYNQMPYDTFLWKGLDGSEVLAHLITTAPYDAPADAYRTYYNGDLCPRQVMGAWKRYQQKSISDQVLLCYGYGDGGGGPTMEMLESGRRMARGIPACPTVECGSALSFFKALKESVSGQRRLPKWVGELYFELHRGTYTSMARNKKYNRKSELLLQGVELASVLAGVLTQYAYPKDALCENWRLLLLNQFHDILPGSSIEEVYEDSQADYFRILASGRALLSEALGAVSKQVSLEEDSLIVFNQLGFARDDIVECDLPDGLDALQIYDLSGNPLDTQISSGRVLFFAEALPSQGYRSFHYKKQPPIQQTDLKISQQRMENAFFDLHLDADGNIISLFDKRARRPVGRPGEYLNILQVFEDRPANYDAWDINLYYREKVWLLDKADSVRVIEVGPVRGVLRIRRTFLESTIEQDIILYSKIPRIDFSTRIDWRERQLLLKAAFPVDVHAEHATFDIQFGNLQRPTHRNTSWDAARFEVCAHKFADLSEDGYGVSLLNDCKYGHDIEDGVMRLTLLKSGIYPNEHADQELHSLTYSLYPHPESWKAAATQEQAYCLNCQPYTVWEPAHSGALAPAYSLFSIDQKNVILDTVKQAENSDGIILRMFESHNRRTQFEMSLPFIPKAVWECDLMENPLRPIACSDQRLADSINPYEIKTYHILP